MTILDFLRENNICLDAACNGLGICGKCKIKIGNLKAFEGERKVLGDKDIAAGYRLACMHSVDECDKGTILKDIKESTGSVVLVDGFMPRVSHTNICDKYGIAIDIGTTTVAMELIDLSNAAIIAKASDINSQIAFGFDVMSRIAYTMENVDGLFKLQKSIVHTLNMLIDKLQADTGKVGEDIAEITVAANTVMCHILLGESVEGLGKYPFSPVFTKSRSVAASDIGIKSDAKVTTLPHISGFVGSDIVAGVYASGLYKDDKNLLFIDIGTNGEIVLKSGNKLLATSCATGPALEGMNISCGMRAGEGAIDNFCIDENKLIYTTVGNKEAVGICGSGVLAMVRELLKNNIINVMGAIDIEKQKKAYDFIAFDKSGKPFIKISDDIYFTSKDIRQVQLAKGAILSGILALVSKAKLELNDISKVYIAGQFGKYISVDSFFSVGLLPIEFFDKVEYLGNTALAGAYMALLDKYAIEDMSLLSNKTEFFELSRLDNYDRIFAKALRFNGENI
nr:ASKHA domain-containing protein [uncultured Lachnoanaerobaculum sp.]